MDFLRIDHILLECWGYPLSYLEAFATFTGLISVWLATRANVLTWPTGIVSVIAFFFLFFQIGLYSDMLLQIFFLIISLYGWVKWQKRKANAPIPVSRMTIQQIMLSVAALIMGTIGLGFLMLHIHQIFTQTFPTPASYPFPDAFTTVASVLATFLMARKKVECWTLWIVVDIVCIILYNLKGIRFVAVEYVIFLLMSAFGLYFWIKKLNSDATRAGAR